MHLQVHENKNTFQCDICGMDFATKFGVRKHKKHLHAVDKHGKPLQFLKEHVCEFCGKSYTTVTNIKLHMMLHHPNEKIDISCGRCNVTFPSVMKLKQHCVSDHRSKSKEERRHQCNVCGRDFKNVNGLKTHQFRVHVQAENLDISKPITESDSWSNCDCCNKVFKSEYYFTEHRKTCNGKFPCLQCEKVFKHKLSLREHTKKVHEGLCKTYSCDICSKVFKTKVIYDFHYKTHLGEALPRCKVCDKSFLHPTTLRSVDFKSYTLPILQTV